MPPAESSAPQPIDEDLVNRQVQILFMQAPVSNATIWVIALLYHALLGLRVDSLLTDLWVLALSVTAGLRFGLWYWRRRDPERFAPRIWRRLYLLSSALIGLSWCLIYPLIYLSNDPLVVMALSMLIFGIVGSGVAVLSIHMPTFLIYTYPQVLTLILTLLWFQDRTMSLMAVACAVYLLMTTLFVHNTSRRLLASIALQAQNAALVTELSDEVAHREALIAERTRELEFKNRALIAENHARELAVSAQHESERRLAAFFGSSPAGMGLLDHDYRYLLVNDTLARMNGLDADAHQGKSVAEVLPKGAHLIEPLLRRVLEKGESLANLDLSGEVPSRPHESSHFSVAYFPVPGADERPSGIGMVVIDITERKRAEDALKASEERFALAMRGANDGLYDWDLVNGTIYYSPRWKAMLGYADNELENQFSTWETLVEAGDRERSWGMLNDYIERRRDNFHLEFRMRHKDGHWVDILSRAFLVRNADGKAIRVVGTHVDISEKKRQEERILHQAHFDGLTNLPNRFLAMDRLNQLIKEAVRSETRAAVLFLDLDGFKRVNDSLGHQTGDRLLMQAAERLTTSVAANDTVCRHGGDEFIVLLGGLAQAADAAPAARRLVSQFREPFRLDERELIVTASVGIAVFPEDGVTPDELLRNADTAMYHSKAEGRDGHHFFTDAMNREVSRRLTVEEQLNGALAREELRLCYQPLIDLASNRIVGVEALLRWRNGTLGDVSPEEFIPIAEQSGTIGELGRFVLAQALERIGRWQKLYGDALRISVNLSPRQFRDGKLVQSITAELARNALEARTLDLEITEGVLISGHAQVDNALADLDRLGIGLAMDDFGTGYSSLSYLRRYPFSVLKIDRSFIADLTHDPADRALVEAAILMAHGLGLRVTAEGIETEEQLRILRQLGCDLGQGYLFSRPLPPEELEGLLAESGPRSPGRSL